jgi:hypothetical protein
VDLPEKKEFKWVLTDAFVVANHAIALGAAEPVWLPETQPPLSAQAEILPKLLKKTLCQHQHQS